jgi:hypothetical protein
MLKKDNLNQFDNMFYDLYKNGFLSEKSYLVGREYHTIFVCGQTHQVFRCHEPLKSFLNIQHFSVTFFKTVLFLPSFCLCKLQKALKSIRHSIREKFYLPP